MSAASKKVSARVAPRTECSPTTHPKCHGCGTVIEAIQPYFPFCSERCKLLDLNGWLSERYRIPDRTIAQDQPKSGEQGPESPDSEN